MCVFVVYSQGRKSVCVCVFVVFSQGKKSVCVCVCLSVVHERVQKNAFIEHVHFYENDELNATS